MILFVILLFFIGEVLYRKGNFCEILLLVSMIIGVLTGDYNVVLNYDYKIYGNKVGYIEIKDFNLFMEVEDLLI